MEIKAHGRANKTTIKAHGRTWLFKPDPWQDPVILHLLYVSFPRAGEVGAKSFPDNTK